jgi:hypothetical protein
MYPHEELTRLAGRKAALQRVIGRRRVQCAEAAAQVSQPLVWLDRMLAYWRQLSPLARLAVVPLGFVVQRTVFPRGKWLGSLVRWVPLAFTVLRSGFRAVRSPR